MYEESQKDAHMSLVCFKAQKLTWGEHEMIGDHLLLNNGMIELKEKFQYIGL